MRAVLTYEVEMCLVAVDLTDGDQVRVGRYARVAAQPAEEDGRAKFQAPRPHAPVAKPNLGLARG